MSDAEAENDQSGTVSNAGDGARDGHRTGGADGAGQAVTGEDAGAGTQEARLTLLDQMGGPMGMLDSGLPVVVFVIVYAIAGLTAGIIAALAAGVLIAIGRLVRHKPVSQALGGLLAVGVAAYIAHRVGSARGYFLFGIWSYVAYGSVTLVSILVRWPLIGVLWEGVNGRGTVWRRDRRLLHRYDAATLVWVAVFAARFAVQQWLYGADQVGWLAFARLAMGYPLFILAIIATVLIVGTANGMRLSALLRRRPASAAEQPATDPATDPASDPASERPAAEQVGTEQPAEEHPGTDPAAEPPSPSSTRRRRHD